jgi:outer membrane protein assembly factor BamD (BamD/ComL family)
MKNVIVFLCLTLSVLFISCPSVKAGGEPKYDNTTPEGMYQEGQHYLKQKKFDLAQRSFATMVEEFPEHELADDAQFMVAEILSNPKNENKDLDAALEEYQNLVDDYPESPFVKKAEQKIEQIEKELEKE